MDFWRSPLLVNLLSLAALLAIAGVLRARIGVLRRLAIPDGIVAGALGLVVGPNLLGWLPTSSRELEPVVYHGFAVVFIAVGLQAAPRARITESARSLSFALIAMAVVQSILGFTILAIWVGASLHPGHGFMIMLGFAQGPGQALAFGSAWEPLGLVRGGQIGLLYAALGFAWCCAFGVPLVAYARRKGWIDPLPPPEAAVETTTTATNDTAELDGRMEPLTVQLVAVGCVYAMVFGVLWLLTRALPEGGSAAASVWGFHFLVGSSIAIGVRRLVDRRTLPIGLDDGLLGRLASTAIDLTTAAALCAIELSALGDVLIPILVLSSCGGALTLVMCLWLAKRAFPEAPFSHALLLYGTATGTMPTGLALLRIVDPALRGPVARSTVLAATAAVPLGMPLFLGVIPYSVARWDSGPQALLETLALLLVYAVVLAWLWRKTACLRWLRPLTSLWPPTPPSPK